MDTQRWCEQGVFTYSGDLLYRTHYKGTGNTDVGYVFFAYTDPRLISITNADGKAVQDIYADNNADGSKNLLERSRKRDKWGYNEDCWNAAGSPVLTRAITNERLARAGYYSILARHESLHLCD